MSSYKFRNLRETSIRLQAARLLLCRLKENKMLDLRGEERIYRNAEVDFLLHHPNELEAFIYTGKTINLIRYKNHKRDKRGKLISVEAYVAD